jgi:hypothetical protein
MSKLLEFCRCGSDADFLNPVVGTAWTKAGTPTYNTCKWGNGQITSASNYWSKYVAVGLQKFSFTFSCKPTSNNVTDTGFIGDAIGGYAGILLQFTGKLNVNIGNVISYPKGCVPYFFNTNAWSGGDIIDLAILFDATASAGNKIKAYQNGADLGAPSSYTEYSGGDWSAVGVGVNVRIGYGAYTNNIIDNFKVWDGVISTNEILQARNNERGGMNDQVIVM